jgi:metal-responsive CopG/Arc/MetJ family transcriptional regulator
MVRGRIKGIKNKAPKTHMKLITLHLPPKWIKDLDSTVPKVYPNRAEAIRIAIRDLLVNEVWGVDSS